MRSLEKRILEQKGFIKKEPRRKSPLELGIKHASRIAVKRAVKDSLGSGLVGALATVVAMQTINKTMK